MLERGLRTDIIAVGRFAGQQAVQQHAQRINIAGGGDGVAADLLGAGGIERHGAHFRTCLGQIQSGRIRAQQLGDSKVEQFRSAVSSHHNVTGLDVAMHHQVLMRELHGGADGAEQLQTLRDRALALLAILVDGRALHVLHDQIRQAVGGGAAIDQTRDIRVFQVGQYLALGAKAAQNLVRIHAAFHHFDRDLFVILVVMAGREPHRAHAAASNAPLKLIRANPIASGIFVALFVTGDDLAEIGGRDSSWLASRVSTSRRSSSSRAHTTRR